MAEFDPSNASVDDVLKKLERADETERQRILNAERSGKSRKTVLEPYGIDPDARVDATGRVLYPWEVSPEDGVVVVEPEEDEAREAREAQAEFDAQAAAATAANADGDEQGGETAADVGVADAGVANN